MPYVRIYNLSTSPCVNSSIGLLVLVTGVHRENHSPAASRWQHNVVSNTPRHERDGIQTHNFSGDLYGLHM
jgi:hypothetical protein